MVLVLAGPGGIVVDQIHAHIQDGLCGLGILRTFNSQELQRADGLADLLAFGSHGELDEQLGLVQVLCTLDDGGAADLVAGAVGGSQQLDVVIALFLIHKSGVQEANADGGFAGGDHGGGAGAGLDVGHNVGIEGREHLKRLLLAVELEQDGSGHHAGAGCARVGHDDHALILGLGQVFPAGGCLNAGLLQGVHIADEADVAGVDAEPVGLADAEVLGLVGSMLAILIGVQQAFLCGRNVGIPGAAVPHVGLRILAFLKDAGVAVVAGQADVAGLDAGLLLEGLDHRRAVFLITADVDHQLAALAGAPVDFFCQCGHAAQRQNQGQCKNQNLLHFSFSLSDNSFWRPYLSPSNLF